MAANETLGLKGKKRILTRTRDIWHDKRESKSINDSQGSAKRAKINCGFQMENNLCGNDERKTRQKQMWEIKGILLMASEQ